jgi:hypothetical protein
MTNTPSGGAATLVHAKYPHNGVKHPVVPEILDDFAAWYEHVLPNGRIGVAVWLYENTDKMLRTIVVREWNNPKSDVYVQGGVHLGAQCSHITNKFLDQLAALPRPSGAAS